jgi:hypothetical protein
MKFYIITASLCLAVVAVAVWGLYAYSHLHSLSLLWR